MVFPVKNRPPWTDGSSDIIFRTGSPRLAQLAWTGRPQNRCTKARLSAAKQIETMCSDRKSYHASLLCKYLYARPHIEQNIHCTFRLVTRAPIGRTKSKLKLKLKLKSDSWLVCSSGNLYVLLWWLVVTTGECVMEIISQIRCKQLKWKATDLPNPSLIMFIWRIDQVEY